MSRQANILSFDEAKRDVGAYRSSRVVPSMPPRFSDDLSTFESPFRQASARGSSSRASASTVRAVASSRFEQPRASARSGRDAVRVEPSRPASVGRHARLSDDPFGASSRSTAADRPVSRRSDEADRDDGDRAENCGGERVSRMAAFKKKRAKDKAGRAFAKQFGDARQGSDGEASGSRAAVYKGEMGAKHRQAARMQNESSPRASKKRGFSFSSVAALKSSPKFIATAAVAACLALSCVFLYPAAQQYYHAVRENDRLQAEYAALEERNEALQSDVSSLQTDSGVEARAHEQFGWVKDGEETATVRGLEIEKEDASTFRANITPGSIEAPDTWYSPFFDALFGVE